jgi:hypothetical protein
VTTRHRFVVDKVEARNIALAQIHDLRRMGWSALRDRYLDSPETVEISGDSGTIYQVEIEAFWDGRAGEDLRVMVLVDDGGWRAYLPLSEDFIIATDGSFVGE